MFDRMKRWFRDVMAKDDLPISQTPEQVLRSIEGSISTMPGSERKEAVGYVKNYANMYFLGRHKQDVPQGLVVRVNALDKRVTEMAVVDAARAFVAKYGPPEKALAHFDQRIGAAQRAHFDTASPAAGNKKTVQQDATQQVANGITI